MGPHDPIFDISASRVSAYSMEYSKRLSAFHLNDPPFSPKIAALLTENILLGQHRHAGMGFALQRHSYEPPCFNALQTIANQSQP
jgi:hypothetical protein